MWKDCIAPEAEKLGFSALNGNGVNMKIVEFVKMYRTSLRIEFSKNYK